MPADLAAEPGACKHRLPDTLPAPRFCRLPVAWPCLAMPGPKAHSTQVVSFNPSLEPRKVQPKPAQSNQQFGKAGNSTPPNESMQGPCTFAPHCRLNPTPTAAAAAGGALMWPCFGPWHRRSQASAARSGPDAGAARHCTGHAARGCACRVREWRRERRGQSGNAQQGLRGPGTACQVAGRAHPIPHEHEGLPLMVVGDHAHVRRDFVKCGQPLARAGIIGSLVPAPSGPPATRQAGLDWQKTPPPHKFARTDKHV